LTPEGETADDRVSYRRIFNDLQRSIANGKYREGQRLPSEAQLTRMYGTSRLTAARALKELAMLGVVERKAGSGTYVRHASATKGRTFGLLIPDLGETEIFEPICQGIARASRTNHDEILWGAATRDVESKVQQALQLCNYYLSKDVAGIFFAPFEHTENGDAVNREIVETLQRASIPIVLLDRDVCRFPARSTFDLVGIDNRRAGYVVTQHLLKLGCERIVFVGLPNSAPTVAMRVAGYRDAMCGSRKRDAAEIGAPDSKEWVSKLLQAQRPDGIVCANDRTAGELMLTLSALGVDIPAQVRIVGIDDVKYASLLHVPLTTLRQPCNDIGAAALSTMVDRVAHPNMPARHVALECKLIVRKSCGAPVPEDGANFIE
jgi:GntR family transcriptional regulator of arabinose operon